MVALATIIVSYFNKKFNNKKPQFGVIFKKFNPGRDLSYYLYAIVFLNKKSAKISGFFGFARICGHLPNFLLNKPSRDRTKISNIWIYIICGLKSNKSVECGITKHLCFVAW